MTEHFWFTVDQNVASNSASFSSRIYQSGVKIIQLEVCGWTVLHVS